MATKKTVKATKASPPQPLPPQEENSSTRVVDEFTFLDRVVKGKRADDVMSIWRAQMLTERTSEMVGLFATAGVRMEPKVDWSIKTAATDGRGIYYNPDFILGLSDSQGYGLLVHEVMHVAFCHQLRRGNRPPVRWNVACDLAINSIIVEMGIALPANGCFAGAGEFISFPKGLCSEEYDALLVKEFGDRFDGPGDGDPYGCGSVLDAADAGDAVAAAAAALEADATILSIQAAIKESDDKNASKGKPAGKFPAGLRRLSPIPTEPAKVSWRDKLGQFLTRCVPNGFTWRRSNRRFAHLGVMMPGRDKEVRGTVAVAVDCSGSVGGEMLAAFSAELQCVCETVGCDLAIYYHDVAVGHIQEWRVGDDPLVLEPHGGGGTSHIPVFEAVARGDGFEMTEPPVALVCLTDMYTVFPGEDVLDIPVIWGVFGGWGGVAPFGEVIHVKD